MLGHACMVGGLGAYHGEMSPPLFPTAVRDVPPLVGRVVPPRAGRAVRRRRGVTRAGAGSSPCSSWRSSPSLIIPPLVSHPQVKKIDYKPFLQDYVEAHLVQSATIDNTTGIITGKLKDGQSYSVNGPDPSLENDVTVMKRDIATVNFNTPTQSALGQWLPTILILVAFVGIFLWISRRAQGQMSGIMSIGRSRARLYTTERPRTTFSDVAGYEGVKVEISEVVDFLKSPHRFRDIGAKIPKGILLVGPPGTGKTLLARAVAGEAGVPFLSVSGSDFMEMFVGVGASRVRDLFQTARKQAPAIIFVDEIDSIGRKRGAGLGGGHDEREQTLNQMLSEMDGFDPAEGVVIMAATNRPDILDPALLRPGRFDRQIVVPLPDLEERLPILKVHCKDKRIGDDVDLELVARGTPGHERGRPRQPRQRGGAARRAPGLAPGRPAGLRGGPRPRAHGSATREPRALRAREGTGRLPRGRARRARLRARARRPGPQGDHPPDRAWRSA